VRPSYILLPVLQLCRVNVIPQMVHTQLLYVLLLPGQTGEAWNSSQKQFSFYRQ